MSLEGGTWSFVYVVVRFFVFVSSQSCNETETNITASTTEMITLESLGYGSGTGSYASNMDCYWTLDSGDDSQKLLLFATYDISCPNDKFYIFDGNTDSAAKLANGLCGKSTSPTHFSTSQRYALIRFISDDTLETAGLSIDFLAAKDYSGSGCVSPQSITPTDTYQFLSTPNFPDTYPGDSNCRWAITNSLGTVELDVIVSDVEDDDPSACDYDKFMIYNGQHRCDHNDVKKVCSEYPKMPTYNYTSTESTALLTFESDSSVNRRGVLLRYRAVNNPTTTTTTTTYSTTTTQKYYKTTKATDLQLDTTMLLGIIFGSLVLIAFTIITVVIVVKKVKVPTNKSITPVQPFRPYETVQKNSVRIRRLNVQSQALSQSGTIRHVPPW